MIMQKSLLLITSILLIFNLKASFIENNGQIIDQNGVVNHNVLFIHSGKNFRVLLTKEGFSYEILVPNIDAEIKHRLLNNSAENIAFNYDFHRIDFSIGSTDFEIEKLAATNQYINYVIRDKAINSSSYKKIVYKNVQPGLHIEFIIDGDNQFKYNIVSEQKNDFTALEIVVNGANQLTLNEVGELCIDTRFGLLKENIPLSYVESNEGRKKEVAVQYKLKGNRLRFFAQENFLNQHLIIDPEPYVEWSTYFGGGGFDWGTAIAVDENENTYQTGLTTSMSNIATSGAFQGSFSGDIDGFLTKFDADGNLLWATYFGGDQTDRTYGITVDGNGDIYLAGSTFSNNNIATPGALQPFIFGMDDMFFMKFDANGQRVWGTYFGGEAHDFPVAITHNNGNIYVTGHTVSANNIGTAGTFLPSKDATEAAFLVSITDNGALLNWGTYIGTTGNSSGESIAAMNDGRIVVAGRTTATGNIASSGAHQDVFSGFVQGFMIVFNTNGTRDWGTYYGGNFSNRADAVAVIDSDIYLAGNTNSNNNIATPNAYQTFPQDEHGFLAKFNDQGVREWGTYVGGNLEDVVKTVAVKNRMIIVGGHTRSTVNIASAGAHQENHVNNFDGFFNAFNPQGEYLWGTYFGGQDDENVNAIAYLNSNAIVFTGFSTGSQGEITIGNAYQPTYGGGPDDVFKGKIIIPCKEISVSNDFNLCAGNQDTLFASGVGDIEWFVNSDLIGTGDTLIISPTATTTYEVVLTDYTNCIANEVVTITADPVDDPSFTFANYCSQGPNGPINIASAGGVFSFATPPGDGATINPITGEITNGVMLNTYPVKYVTDGICPDSLVVNVTVLETDDPSFEYLDLCENDIILPTYIATSGGEFSFAQAPPNNEGIDGNTGEISDAVAGTTYEVTYTTPAGDCQASQTETITIIEAPVVNAGDDFEMCVYHQVIPLEGEPGGGVFSGNGVTNNSFSPDEAGIGTHEIIYSFTATNGCFNADTMEIEVDACLNVMTSTNSMATIFPNPTNGSITIDSPLDEIIKIEIYDMTGRKLYAIDKLFKNTFQVELSSFAEGVYNAIVFTKQSTIKINIVKH
jgi:hypothetical protein